MLGTISNKHLTNHAISLIGKPVRLILLDKNGKLINPEVRIENCNLCNANCTICTRDAMTRKKGIMGMKFFEILVLLANDFGSSLISPFGFGEPLLDRGLESKISICDEHGFDTFITTNGSLCTWNRIYDLFSCGLKHIRFSVNGVTKQTYKEVQRGLDFDQVLTNIYSTLYMRSCYHGI